MGCSSSSSSDGGGGTGDLDGSADQVAQGDSPSPGNTNDAAAVDQVAQKDSAAGDAAGGTEAGGGSDGGSTGDAAGTDARTDSGSSSGGSACSGPSDCRKYSNYCGGCTCDALGVSAPDPTCDAGLGSCLVDPCSSHTAVCDSTHHCALQ
jgi:hypothetical protein